MDKSLLAIFEIWSQVNDEIATKDERNAFHSKNSYTSFLTFNSNKKGFMPEIPSHNNHSLKLSISCDVWSYEDVIFLLTIFKYLNL